MRILMVGASAVGEDFDGGLNRYFLDLKNFLEQKKHRVETVYPDSSLSTTKRLFAFRKDLKKKLSEFEADIISAHFALYTIPLVDLKKKVPLIFHFHGPWYLEKQAEGAGAISCYCAKLVEEIVYKKATQFICLSNSFKSLLSSEYGVDASKIEVVPGAVSKFFQSDSLVEKHEELHSEIPKIFCVRRLVKRVGIDLLIRSASVLSKKGIAFKLLIAGKGPEERSLRELVNNLGLEGTVEFLGYVKDEDLKKQYQTSFVSVVPSIELEGFGLVVAESLSAGCPVIVTPVGGLGEIVRNLDESLICKDISVEALASRIEDALTKKDLPSRQRCKEFATENFSWEKLGSRVEAIYAKHIQPENKGIP